MPVDQVDPDATPGLARFCRTRLPDFLAAVDAGRALRIVRDVVAHDCWNSFDGFHRTNQTLLSAYESCGCGAELYTIPTGGARGDGKWIIPEAEDFRAATIDLIEPIGRRLLDYAACPWHVVQWSAATAEGGVTGELVVIDSVEQLARAPAAAAGKIVLTRLDARESRAKFSAAGVAAVIFDQPARGFPGAVAWTKFGWGCPDLGGGASPLAGFAISSASGDELRELHRRHGRLVLRAKLDVRRYAGSHGVVSGLIRGRDDPDAEIWAVAHAAEPGALDNASGVAACVEIARAINDLIRTGRLPPPRRTIRLLHGYECYGFFHYLQHATRLQPPLAGVCVDTVGARPDACGGKLRWHASAPASASFADDVGAAVLRRILALRSVYQLEEMPFLSTEDTLLGDPKYGFPCPWITNHPAAGYHSSADTLELLDGQGLAACAAATAGYLYYLADMGTDDALEIARDQTRRTTARLGGAKLSAIRAESLRQQHDATVRRLARFVWTGDHGEITREFDAMTGRVAAVAGGKERCPEPFSGRGRAPGGAGVAGSENAARDGAGGAAGAGGGGADPRSALVPLRRLPLAPTPENVWPHVRGKLGEAFPKWAVYWADGERSVADIAALASLDAGAALELPRVIDHFAVLAELGYVDLVRPADFATGQSLAADFAALGVREGMDFIIHSSLKSVGPVRGGAGAVVRALLSILGPGGTLLAPSFNHFRARAFNPLCTPTTNGAIPEAVWRRADARRSLHPSHSVAAVGPRAEDYLRDHLTSGVWSPDSPIGRLVSRGGYVLSVGVGHDRSTAYHLAEISLTVPCLDSFGSTDRVVQGDGRVRPVPGLAWRADECPVDPRGLDSLLDPKQSRGTVGRAPATLVPAADIFAARREQLGHRCATCPVRPAYRNGPARAGAPPG